MHLNDRLGALRAGVRGTATLSQNRRMTDPLRVAAWRFALDAQPVEQLPALATDALVRGVDSPSLRELAGERASDVHECRDLFRAALDELDLAVAAHDAVWCLTQWTAEQIVSEDLSPYEGAAWIWREAWRELEHVIDLTSFVALADQWEDLPSHRAEIDADIIAEAHALLERRATPSP